MPEREWRLGQGVVDERRAAAEAFRDGRAGDAPREGAQGRLWLREAYVAGRVVWSPWLGDMLGVPEPKEGRR